MSSDTPLNEKEVQLAAYALSALHKKWTPHPSQALLCRAVFSGKYKKIFAQPGRRWGKTECAIYVAWRIALSRPRSQIYFYGPLLNQIREILWANDRLTGFGPGQFVKRIYRNDGRLIFYNDSFIKIEGADNPDKCRGIEMDFLIMDEVRNFHPDFWPAIEPTLLTREAPWLALGTPPDNDIMPSQQFYFKLADDARASGYWCRFETGDNPRVNKTELERIKYDYEKRGEDDVYKREYQGIFVKGGHSSIFPMFNRAVHVLPHATIIERLRQSRHALEHHTVADPGTKSVFGQLFIAFDPYTNEIYVLDELYVKDQAENSTRPMFEKEKLKIMEFHPHPSDWLYTYDEAAAWFANERNSINENLGWVPTHKAAHKQEAGETKPGVTLLKDIMLEKKIWISDRCTNLCWEIESYVKNRHGEIPKGRDHCVTGDTLVWTTKGKIPIKSLVGQTGFVHGPDGPERFSNVRRTREKAEVFLVGFEDGSTLTCTADHLLSTKAGWLALRNAKIGTRLLKLNESDCYPRSAARLQWRKLLPFRQVFLSCLDWLGGQTSSGGLGVPQRADTSGDGHSPPGRRPGKQLDRESSDASRGATPESSHDLCPQRTPTTGRTEGPGQLPREISRLAQDTPGQEVAQRERQTSLEENAADNQSLLLLRQGVSGKKEPGETLQVLPPELQNEPSPLALEDLRITLIEPAGVADVYNMEVENTHCFAVGSGIIIHNCIDILRYFMYRVAYQLSSTKSLPTPADPNREVRGYTTRPTSMDGLYPGRHIENASPESFSHDIDAFEALDISFDID